MVASACIEETPDAGTTITVVSHARVLPQDTLLSPIPTPQPLKVKEPRLYLRLLSESDLEDYHAIWSDEAATKWSSRGVCRTLSESLEWMRNVIPRADNPSCLNYGVFEIPTSSSSSSPSSPSPPARPRMIGICGSFRSNPPSELGYIFHPSVWGKGYASEAVALFLDKFWNIHLTGPPYEEIKKVEFIVGLVDPENVASRRVLLKNGFREEEVKVGEYRSRETGELRDLIVYRMDRPGIAVKIGGEEEKKAGMEEKREKIEG